MQTGSNRSGRLWSASLLVVTVMIGLGGAGSGLADVVGSISISLDNTLLDKPQPISGHVDFSTDQMGLLEVTIEWNDGYTRTTDRQVSVIELPGQTSVNFSFSTDVALTMNNSIAASAIFIQTQDTLSTSRQGWEMLPDPVDIQDYHASVWGGGDASSALYFDALEQANVNCGHMSSWSSTYYGGAYNVRPNHDMIEGKGWFELTDSQHDPKYGIYQIALTVNHDYYLPSNRQALIRAKSLSSASIINAQVNTFRTRMWGSWKWRPMQWNIADEYGTGRRDYPFDYDLGEDCISQFVAWLQDEYNSLGQLNTQWGTSFGSWNDLTDPINAPQGGEAALIVCQEMRDREFPLYADTTGAKNFSPWSDFRRHMELTMANAMQQCVDAARAIDTGVPIGWEGGEAPSPMNGYDYWLQMRMMSSFEAYDLGNSPEYARAFRDNKYGQQLLRWITMFDTGSPHRNRYKLWFHLIHHGQHASVIWWDQNFFTGAYELTNYALGLAPAYGEFRGGLAKLLSQGEHDDAEVALYYSQRSNHITWQYDSEVNGIYWLQQKWADRRQRSLFFTHTGWLKALEDVGIKGRFVSYEQITNGELISNGYKVLVMPLVKAMSDDEITAVQDFANAGGVVVADSQTAIFDGHCKRRSIAEGGGLMDSWFGINRLDYYSTERNRDSTDAYSGSVYLQTPPSGFEALTQELSSPVSAGWHGVEDGVRVSDGTAVGLFQNNANRPVLIVKNHGAGKSVYMNLTLFRYAREGNGFTEERRNPSDTAAGNLRQLVRNLMALGGVSPKVDVLQGHDAPVDGTEVYNLEKARYVDGQNTYLACVVNSYLETYDWSEQSDTSFRLFGQWTDPADVTLVLASPAHVYDVRQKTYLGYGTRINAAQPVLEGGIFALLPYQVTGLSLESISFDSKQRASLTVSVQTSGGPAGRHVFRLEVFDPLDQEMNHLTSNVVASGGTWSGNIFFGVDEPIVDCTIRLTDVATGAQVEYVIPPQPPLIQQVSPDPDSAFALAEYVEQLYLVQGSPPITWTLLSGPGAAVVDQNGRVSGWAPQPADVGHTFDFEVEARNDADFEMESWQVTVFAPAAPEIEQVSPDPDSATVDHEYVRQLNLIAGGQASMVWTMLNGPAAATVDQDGMVYGWTPPPNQIGKSFTLQVEVQNFFGSDTETWQVEVPPAIPGFVEEDGMVVFEAEHYDSIKGGAAPVDDVWTLQTGHFSVGEGYMQALPDNDDNVNDPDIESLSPRMSYTVRFTTTGTYYLWARSQGPDDSGDSFHYGLDGGSFSTSFGDSPSAPKNGQLEWRSELPGGGQPTIVIGSPGSYSVDIWMREDGCMIDRLLLTTDGGYTPSGNGPSESLRVMLVAGDLDHDGDVDLDDCTLLDAALNGPATPPGDPQADLDGDGDCDLADFALFARNFSGSV